MIQDTETLTQRKGLKLFAAFLAILFFAVVVILALGLQTKGDIAPQPQLTDSDLARLQQLFLDNTPEHPRIASLEDITLNNEELNLLSRYALNLMGLEAEMATNLNTDDSYLDAELSYRLNDTFLPLFLNLDVRFQSIAQQPSIEAIKIGNLPIPRLLIDYVEGRFRQSYFANRSNADDIRALLGSIQQIDLQPELLRVVVAWDPVIVERLTQQAQLFFISEQDQQMIVQHYQLIGEVINGIPIERRAISINELLIPLFDAAKNRSLQGSNPIDENRTLFQTLALYVNNEPLTQLLPEALATTVPQAKFIEVRLQRRQDLARHLSSMAALTSSTKAEVAEMLSTTKEAYDARYSSGFSFSDIAANIAGVALGKLATENVSTAHLLQQRLSLLQDEDEYMPSAQSNRDGLSESEFSAQYTDRSSKGYLSRIEELETLIYSSPLFMVFPMIDLRI